VRKHHRNLLRLHLQQIDSSDAAIAQIDREVDANLASFRTRVELLTSIPGVAALGGQTIVSEIGIDMSRFATAGHLISWVGLCPRNDESAGKRRSTRLRKGAPWLKTMLIQCAWAASRRKGSYLQAQYHRLRARRGAQKAICAVRLPYSPPPITCSRMAPATMTSDPIISAEVLKKSKPSGCSSV
jgi:transposase